MSQLILLNKPYHVLSQFSDNDGRTTLAHFISQKGVYPAGRLDYDSEGLLLLTDDGVLQQQIANPKHKLPKTYWVQVEGKENPEAIKQLRQGVTLKDGKTRPAIVEIIPEPQLWPRTPPVRFRQSVPTHWLSITISEGKNRQVRRMTASVNLPTLRLVRASIGSWSLSDLGVGEHQVIQVHMPAATKQARGRSALDKNHRSPHAKKRNNKRRSTLALPPQK